MIRSRRWLMFPFVAICAFLVSGVSLSQEPDPPKPTTATEKVEALKKVVETLKTSLTATEKDLAAAKKDAATAKKAADDASKAAKDAATAAEELKVKLEALPKPVEKPAGPDEETKKAVEAAAKAGSDADAKAVTATQRGDTSWLLTSSAFVLFMVPGLALFYGGMVKRKNVLATMMQSMAALAVVGVYWVAVGYGLAFGPSVEALKLSFLGVDGGGFIGWSSDLFFMKGIATDMMLPQYNVPVYVHMMFQGMFAIITPALISGAIAERIRFWPFCIYMILWITVVYCPLAHMVWAFDFFDPAVEAGKRGLTAIGFLGKLGALDFAGGTVVHIAAGMAGLACCLVLRKRDGYPKTVAHPNSMVLTLLGAGMLWFGWFGFNGGSGLNSSGLGGSAFAATQAAAATAGLVWMLIEWLHKGKPTALGLASGIVAGLVAVTPASGFVYVWGGMLIGVAVAVICYGAVYLKGILGYDDSLDAFGVHGVGGFVGAVLTGVLCYNAVNGATVLGAGNDGYFAVTGKTFTEKFTELDGKLTSEQKEQAEKASTDDEKGALSDDQKAYKMFKTMKDNGPMAQTMIQIKASVISVVYAFIVSLILCIAVQAMTLGNFSTSVKDETIGLDQTEHGEAGFDFGYASQSMSATTIEPKAATAPKGEGRFALEVSGATHSELMKVWSTLAQSGTKPADADFVAVYPYVTTISGTTFRCRGGNAEAITKRLDVLFKKHLPGKPVKVAKA